MSGASIDNVQIGVTGDNEIDTSFYTNLTGEFLQVVHLNLMKI